MNRLDFIKKIKLPKFKRPTTRQMIFWGVMVVLAIGVFVFVRGFTACWSITNLPGIPLSTCAGGSANPNSGFSVNGQGTPVGTGSLPPTPVSIPEAVLPPAWDGASRINILFIGLDYRDWLANEGPPRSDTMILFSIDPISKTAGMLSIPRDMWVNIPGFGYSRINTAYPSGEGAKLPGGGPALAMKTVEQFIGVPVNYYAQVDFGTFTSFIDYLGGIDVYVDQTLTIDLTGSGYDQLGKLSPNSKVTLLGKNSSGRFYLIDYPTGPGGKAWVIYSSVTADGLDTLPVIPDNGEGPGLGPKLSGVINKDTAVRAFPGDPNHVRVTCCGYREMSGEIALAYARDRHTQDGDVDRAKRQQQVIFAIQKKIFDPAVFPGLIANAPKIFQQFSSGIHTNMNLEDAIKLAILGKDISRESIKSGVIDTHMVTFANVVLAGQNASIMKPIMDKVRVLRDEIFTTTGPTSPLAKGDPGSLMRAEGARVRILDGTFTAGLGQRAGTFFQSQGMGVTEVGNAQEAYSSTVVIVYGPKLYTVRYLQSLIGLTSNQIRFSPDPTSSVDIEIRIGSDIAKSIP
jgi:LCP family protein required for cell wall assembly